MTALENERDELVERLGRMQGEVMAASRMITDRDAEIARLREALERIEDLDWSDGEDAAVRMQVEAHAALAKEDG